MWIIESLWLSIWEFNFSGAKLSRNWKQFQCSKKKCWTLYMKKNHVKFGFELFKYSGSLPILTSFAHHTTNYLFTADDICHTLFMSKRWLISLRMNIKTLQTNKTENWLSWHYLLALTIWPLICNIRLPFLDCLYGVCLSNEACTFLYSQHHRYGC